MLISDFLASQAVHPDDLAWAGSPLPAHAALAAMAAMAAADRDGRGPVQVSMVRTGDPAPDLAVLDGLADGDRAVLLTDALPAEPAIEKLAVALADRGFELLHAVYIDDAAGIGVHGGLSVQRCGPDADPGLSVANLAAVTVDGRPNWERARAAFSKIAARHETALVELDTVRAEHRAVGRHPVRWARRFAGMLVGAWRSRRRPTTDGRPGLDFHAPMPVPPDGDRSRPAALHIAVPSSYIVARHLHEHGIGGYEESMMAWYLALCDTAQPGAVWDVGANLGPYALLARAYTAREVVAFEPTPDLARWARRIAAANGLDYRLEQLAAGESAGTATFYLSESSDSSNSLAEGFRASKQQLDVLVEPLDRYARRTGSRPAVLKVDTETTEHLVMLGAREVVAKHRPWVFCEVLANRPPEKALTAIMGELGYRFFHLDGSDPLPETSVIKGDPTSTHLNYLFAPAEIDERTAAAARAWHAALEATPRR